MLPNCVVTFTQEVAVEVEVVEEEAAAEAVSTIVSIVTFYRHLSFYYRDHFFWSLWAGLQGRLQ